MELKTKHISLQGNSRGLQKFLSITIRQIMFFMSDCIHEKDAEEYPVHSLYLGEIYPAIHYAAQLTSTRTTDPVEWPERHCRDHAPVCSVLTPCWESKHRLPKIYSQNLEFVVYLVLLSTNVTARTSRISSARAKAAVCSQRNWSLKGLCILNSPKILHSKARRALP